MNEGLKERFDLSLNVLEFWLRTLYSSVPVAPQVNSTSHCQRRTRCRFLGSLPKILEKKAMLAKKVRQVKVWPLDFG